MYKKYWLNKCKCIMAYKVMKNQLLFIVALTVNILAFSQCYEPNMQKANAAYAHGNWSTAYEYYKKALRCPDAKHFENGKKAKEGMNNCKPVLKINGQNELKMSVEPNVAELTFKVISSKLDSDGWDVGETNNCKIVKIDKQNNSITVKWNKNLTVDDRKISFYLRGYGIDYVAATAEINQKGWQDGILTIPSGEKYDSIYECTSGISFVLYHGRYGYLDSNGTAITSLKYTYSKKKVTYNDMCWENNEMLKRVYLNGKYGYINKKGKEVIPIIYDTVVRDALRYGISTTVVRKGGKYGLLNGKGEEVLSCIYDDFVSTYNESYPVFFKKNDKWALFGIGAWSEGKFSWEQLTEFKYDWVCTCGFPGYTSLCRVAVTKIEGNATVYKKGYVNLGGVEIIPPQFDTSYCFGDNNRAVVKANGKYGFINSIGKIVIPCKYDDAEKFSKGVAWVKENGLWNLIDTAGNVITKKGYRKIFYDGKPWVSGYEYMGYAGYLVSTTGRDTVIVGNYGKEYRSKNDFKNDFGGLVEAAEKGIDACQHALSQYYLKNKDYVKSFEWCRRAAQGGNPKIIATLADKYYHGSGCEKDYDKYIRLHLRAAAFNRNASALNNCGYALWLGYGCKRDRDTAIGYLYLGALSDYMTWPLEFIIGQGVDTSELKPY